MNSDIYRLLNEADRLLSEMISMTPPSFPPYDIEKVGEHGRRIVLAVPGFNENSLRIVLKENVLTVEGACAEDSAEGSEQRVFLHRGIARRPFKQVFRLAPDVKVDGAELRDGLLTIELSREGPAENHRRIEIRTMPKVAEA